MQTQLLNPCGPVRDYLLALYAGGGNGRNDRLA